MSSVETPAIRFHPDFVLNKYSIGHEQSPLLVIDNFIAEPQVLIDQALTLSFAPVGKSFPGIRAIAPQVYQQFLLTQLRPYGGTAPFEQINKQDGIFNRILIYRRNILHSGCIDKDFIPDPNPLTGRLSINSFIDVL